MKKRSLMIVGPALSRSGYGEQTRFAIQSLVKVNKYDLYLHNTNWGNSSWIPYTDSRRSKIDKLISKTVRLQNDFRSDISLQVGIPTDFKIYSEVNIGYTAGTETDSVSEEWVVSCNMMNGIITPSTHSRLSLENTTGSKVALSTMTRVVNFPFTLGSEHSEKNCRIKSLLKETSREFNFLTVAQISPRKNILNLIKWFLNEFGNDEKKALYLKIHRRDCSTIDRFETEKKIKDFIQQVAPNKRCGVFLIHGDLNRSEIKSLYQSGFITHYLSASHGEGFGIPVFDAAASGLVTVTPVWSGESDYLVKQDICPVNYEVKKVAESDAWPGIINPDSSWAYVTQDSFRSSLRASVQEYDTYKKRAKILSRKIKKKFTAEKQIFMFNQAIEDIINKGERIYVKQNSH